MHAEKVFRQRCRCFIRCELLFRLGLLFRDFLELGNAVAHDFRRNSEPESLRRDALRSEGHFGRTDPDQSPGNIDHWPAAVARIDRRIRLHEIFIFDVVDGDLAFGCAQNAAADGAAISDGIAHHEDCLTEQVWRNIIEANKWEGGFGVDFDEGQVRIVVARNVMLVVSLAIVCRDLELQVGGALNHMLVGYNVSRRIDNES